MNTLYVLCVDDQREVLKSLLEDLEPLENHLEIESAENPDEAWDVIEDIDRAGNYLAVVISDHIMPGKTGVEFLVDIKSDARFKLTKKVLLTGLATHKDTIEAINKADLDNYIEKPWDKEQLIHIVKVLLTKFIIENGMNYQDKTDITDPETLFELLRK